MFIFKLITWLSIYFTFYIIFSVNTLISIFCFIIVVFIIGILLLSIHVEYSTYLVFLLYLGGILIFFLFTALMLSNEYNFVKSSNQTSFDNILFLLITLKIWFLTTALNFNISTEKSYILNDYFPTHIENNYYLKDLVSNHSDIYNFFSLFTEKYVLLFILGNILLFTMIGVIVITKK